MSAFYAVCTGVVYGVKSSVFVRFASSFIRVAGFGEEQPVNVLAEPLTCTRAISRTSPLVDPPVAGLQALVFTLEVRQHDAGGIGAAICISTHSPSHVPVPKVRCVLASCLICSSDLNRVERAIVCVRVLERARFIVGLCVTHFFVVPTDAHTRGGL